MMDNDNYHLRDRFEARWQAGLPLQGIWLFRFAVGLMLLFFLVSIFLPKLEGQTCSSPGSITWAYGGSE